MTIIVTFLILTPIITMTCIGIAADERWQLTDRLATTRLGQWVRQHIAQHIDGDAR